MKRVIAIAVAAAAFALAAPAAADHGGYHFGDDFGVAPINGAPPQQTVPALPGLTHMWWAGVCETAQAPAPGSGIDLADLTPAGIGMIGPEVPVPNGQTGVFAHASVPAPGTPAHCMDWGAQANYPTQDIWSQAPAWRLPPQTQAGGHPDGTANMAFARVKSGNSSPGAGPGNIDGALDNIYVELPPGFVADPNAVNKCTAEQFAVWPPQCPPESQIGVLQLSIVGVQLGGSNLGNLHDTAYPVWNLEPRMGNLAELGFAYASGEKAISVRLVAKARTNSDHGVATFVGQIPTSLPPVAQQITIWGVPWAASNDLWRVPFGQGPGTDPEGCGKPPGVSAPHYSNMAGFSPSCQAPYDPSWGEIKPFVSNVTECTGSELSTRLAIDSFQNPGAFVSDGSPYITPSNSKVGPNDGDPDYPEPIDNSLPGWKVYDAAAPAITGCEEVGFSPDITLDPSGPGGTAVGSADSPAGLDVELSIPQNNELPFDPPAQGASQSEVDDYVADASDHWRSDAGVATSHLKDTVVTLPEGMTLNPSAADGQGVCSMEQIGVTDTNSAEPPAIRFDNSPVGCPESAKVAEVVVETPALDQADWPEGYVYLAAQGDNPFGSDFAIYIAVESPDRGLIVKLAGEVVPDPQTGRLTTTFVDNPQLPFEEFKLRFKPGPRAALATPSVCGTHTNVTSLAPYSDPGNPRVVNDPFEITSSPAGGCATNAAARPFEIDLSAGSAQVGAGEYSAFHARFQRGDGNQEFDRIELSTPLGLTAKLAGIPYCPEDGIQRAIGRTATGDGALEKANPSCPEASKVGTTTVGAGAGSNPFYVTGNVYLAGPYKDAPLSMVFIVPAVAGPFDLGVQVVRAQLQVDPFTARITTVSDDIPEILRGVPLRIRDIRVDITRPEFTLNPTNCNEQAVYGTVYGASGAETRVGNRFVVDGCRDLAFKPRFRARILDKGRRSTLRSWNPRTRFVVTPRPGDANIGGARVALPASTILDQSNLDTTCTRARMAAEDCPAGSVVGFATAWSPLLDEPVQGRVYLAANGGVRRLPDLVAVLDGQIRVSLLGEVSTLRTGGKARLQNTFRVVPDAPVSRFVLTMRGGKERGLLVNSTDLCRTNERGVAVFRGHNGRVSRQRLRIGLSFKGCKRVRKQAARRAAKRKAARKKARRAVSMAGRAAGGLAR